MSRMSDATELSAADREKELLGSRHHSVPELLNLMTPLSHLAECAEAKGRPLRLSGASKD